MTRSVRHILGLVAMVVALAAVDARGDITVRVGDVTKLKGHSVNHLVGNGLVVGLNGTGDSDDYEVTMRALAETLGKLAAPVNSLEELADTSNVAIVMVEAVIPENGVREGDRIKVHVSAIGSASNLSGGRLLVCPLMYNDLNIPRVFAMASGPVYTPDPSTPTVGVVERGALIQEDVLLGFTASGRELPFSSTWIQSDDTYLTLVLDDNHAGWGLAVAIAEAINAELSLAADTDRVAMAADAKNVIVWIPPFQRNDPAAWIRDIKELSTLMPPSEARVTIDRASGTIVVSGDARISPAIVSQKGLTVVVRTPPPPDEVRIESRPFVSVGTDNDEPATVSDLLQALNQLQAPMEDRISILTELQRAGKLHARIIFKE